MNRQKQVEKIKQSNRRLLRKSFTTKPWYVPKFIWLMGYRAGRTDAFTSIMKIAE